MVNTQRSKRRIKPPKRYKHTSSDADKYKRPKITYDERSLEQTLRNDVADIKKKMQTNDMTMDSGNSGFSSNETESGSDKKQNSSRHDVRSACENHRVLAPSNIDNLDNGRSFSDARLLHYTSLQPFQPNALPLASADDSNNVSNVLYTQYTDNRTNHAEGVFNPSQNGNCWMQAQPGTVLPVTATSTTTYVHPQSYETPGYVPIALTGPTKKNTNVSDCPPVAISEPIENSVSRRNTPSMAIHERLTETAMPLSHNSAILYEIRKLNTRFDQVDRELQNVRKENRELKNSISRYIERRMPTKPDILPLKSIQAFEEFENDENLFNETVVYFKWLGGYTLKDSIHSCMTDSLSTEISEHFTWWGNEKKEKLPLYKSKLIQAIYQAVSQNTNFQSPTRVLLQESVSESLRVIKQKKRNHMSRKENNPENIRNRRCLENENLTVFAPQKKEKPPQKIKTNYVTKIK